MLFWFFCAVLILTLLLLTWLFWASKGIQAPRVFQGRVIKRSDAHCDSISTTTKKFRVVTWNFSFGYGIGSAKSSFQRPSREHLVRRLFEAAETLKKLDADLILLQELDFDSSRTHHLNQLEFLSKELGFCFYAEAPSWTANYVPHPPMNFKEHFGKMNSGGGLLSKFPILKNEITLLQKPKKFSWIYRLFYLFRFFQNIEIQIHPSKKLRILNLHLEAFDSENRNEQAEQLVQTFLRSPSLGNPVGVDLVAGDFNSVYNFATQKSGFLDDSRADFKQDQVLSKILEGETLKDVLPERAYLQNEAAHFTHPTDTPNRRLDHILFNPKTLKLIETAVERNCHVSDHFPIWADFEL